MRPFQDSYSELGRSLVNGIDILDSQADPRPRRVLAWFGLREVEQHVIAGGEVSPGNVVMEGLVPAVLMRLVEFEPEKLSVELRRRRQVGGPKLQAVETRHDSGI